MVVVNSQVTQGGRERRATLVSVIVILTVLIYYSIFKLVEGADELHKTTSVENI